MSWKKIGSPRAQEFLRDRAELNEVQRRMGELLGHDELREIAGRAERRSPKSTYSSEPEHDEDTARVGRTRRAAEAAAAAAVARAETRGIDLDGIAVSPRTTQKAVCGAATEDSLLLEMLQEERSGAGRLAQENKELREELAAARREMEVPLLSSA